MMNCGLPAAQKADVICIQETKAQVHQLTDAIFSPEGYHCYYEDAEKKGYSGTAIYTRHKPKKVVHGYGDAEFDFRYVRDRRSD